MGVGKFSHHLHSCGVCGDAVRYSNHAYWRGGPCSTFTTDHDEGPAAHDARWCLLVRGEDCGGRSRMTVQTIELTVAHCFFVVPGAYHHALKCSTGVGLTCPPLNAAKQATSRQQTGSRLAARQPTRGSTVCTATFARPHGAKGEARVFLVQQGARVAK